MIAIKNWFMAKNNLEWLRNYTLEMVKETEKAMLVRLKDRTIMTNEQYWIPKSCIIEKWEKDTSNFAYHRYLEDCIHRAYDAGELDWKPIKSGRNVYRGDAFVHQNTTKGLINLLEKEGIKYMNREEWNNREE